MVKAIVEVVQPPVSPPANSPANPPANPPQPLYQGTVYIYAHSIDLVYILI